MSEVYRLSVNENILKEILNYKLSAELLTDNINKISDTSRIKAGDFLCVFSGEKSYILEILSSDLKEYKIKEILDEDVKNSVSYRIARKVLRANPKLKKQVIDYYKKDNTSNYCEIELIKSKDEFIQINAPAVKQKNEIAKLEDDIKISYERKKKEKKDNNFELIIEMHAPKDLKLEKSKQKSALPAVLADRQLKQIEPIDNFYKLFTEQINFYLEFQRTQNQMFLKAQKLFWDNYFKMFYKE